MFVNGKKDKGFSSKNKVQRYHSDGTETITMMGKSFRVLMKLNDVPAPHVTTRRRVKYSEDQVSHVYLVENTSRLPEFPRHLALKRSFFAVDQVAEAHKELDILTRVKDKNIVKVYHSEIVRSEGKLSVSIAMEYCANSLYRRIRSGTGSGAGVRLSESDICHILMAVTSAVGYLHTRQPPIAHRDIRLENILINNNQVGPVAYKLCNFGGATTEAYQCESREEASMAIADIERHTNPAFRAPEMADPWSKRRVCEKADMWSIGVLLYYMTYLKLPFEATNMALSGNPKVRFPPNDEGRYAMSGSLRVVMEHLLDPDPATRWDVFALTNFIRFDEDVSRHLGTFCFSKTEWPEGWEEQDVKVINRDTPRRAPAINYNGEPGHDRVGDDHEHEESTPPPPSTRAPAASCVHGSRRDGGSGDATSSEMAAIREAMLALGIDDNYEDPEMAQYHAMMMLEEQQSQKAIGQDNDATGDPEPSAVESKTTAKEKKPDLFDNLFGDPVPAAEPQPAPSQQQPAAASATGGSAPSAAPPAAAPEKDIFRTDDLFSTPAPTNPQGPAGMNYGNPYQQLQPMMSMPMMGGGGGAPPAAMASGWGSGIPMQQQQYQQALYADPMAMGSMPYQPQQQQQPGMMMGGGWGRGGGGGAPMAQPPAQGAMDFMAPAQGTSAPPPAPAAPKKDPFEDLFS